MRRVLFAIALAAALPLCHDAFAGDSVLAESLFRQGRALMDKGDFGAACPRLSESYVQDPSTGTLLALAFCQEHLGQTASAWASYAEVVTRSKREGHADREQAARERADALEAKLSRLTIQVPGDVAGTPGLVVTRDGVAVGQGAWGTPTPLDPGEHVIGATAPGKEPWSLTLSIGKELDTQTVTVPSLAAPPAPPAGTAADTAPAGSRPFFNGSPLQTAGLVTAGVGVIGLGASLFFGLHASSLNKDSNSDGHCTPTTGCDPYGVEKRNDAASAADTATILLIAGAGLTATGATLFVLGSSKRSESARLSPRIEGMPLVGPGLAAMTVRGQF